MKRLSGFVMGFVLGGACVFTGLKYHVVRASNGFHLIPKSVAVFAEAYVDIRQFTFQDWQNHPSLAAALVRANKADLMRDAAGETMVQGMQGVVNAIDNGLDQWGRPRQP